MKRFIQTDLINAGLVLVVGISAASLSSVAYADKIAVEPTNYALHLDEIGPAAAIGESAAALKIKLQAHRVPSFAEEQW